MSHPTSLGHPQNEKKAVSTGTDRDVDTDDAVDIRRGNERMLKLMNAAPVRDAIAEMLSIRDVFNATIAGMFKCGIKHMSKYMDPFRLVIPNRKWLVDRIKEGYKFTIVSPHLDILAHMRPCPRRVCMTCDLVCATPLFTLL